MATVNVTHPEIEGVHQVPESSLSLWQRSGWRLVEETQEQPGPVAEVEPVDPAPRRRNGKEGA